MHFNNLADGMGGGGGGEGEEFFFGGGGLMGEEWSIFE